MQIIVIIHFIFFLNRKLCQSIHRDSFLLGRIQIIILSSSERKDKVEYSVVWNFFFFGKKLFFPATRNLAFVPVFFLFIGMEIQCHNRTHPAQCNLIQREEKMSFFQDFFEIKKKRFFREIFLM